ncbi:MAG: aldehyde dehydrogenase (NADP(+)) [Phycisphaerales bacterium]|nr:aldehyde dehydrogenase (NADP(+)) [Phycisphaerales bacterium]
MNTAESMALDPTRVVGRSIVAGNVVADSTDSSLRFRSFAPAGGLNLPPMFQAATDQEVDGAARAAAEAFPVLRDASGSSRAALLERIAEGLAGLGDTLTELASAETGLPVPRIAAERDRTLFQLRLFAEVARTGDWVEACIEHGDPSRSPAPRPDLRRMLRPLGPVAVFGASNFPLAFSVAGGDTASALAAGCPVVVKGHPLHPATGELVATTIADAVAALDLPVGCFAFLHAGGARSVAVGEELVRHAAVAAVGFTGSHAAGMALARLAASRREPVPVFCEMGSVNPVFVLPAAMAANPTGWAQTLFSSVTGSVGQMCTCPGVVFVVRSAGSELFVEALEQAFRAAPAQPMLSARIHAAYAARIDELSQLAGVRATIAPEGPGVAGRPAVLVVDWNVFRSTAVLAEECFGPSTVVVECDDLDVMEEAAAAVHGTLAASLWMNDADQAAASRLFPRLERRAGRVVVNGPPTGVEVSAAMVHTGPAPASNRPDATAVGPLSIRRWCRPVCFQNVPDALLPPELKDANPLGIERWVDGVRNPPARTSRTAGRT